MTMNKPILTKFNVDYGGDLYKGNILGQNYPNKTTFETHQIVSKVVGCNNYTTIRISMEGEE